MSTLKLTLKQPWFNLMLSGEKTKEYREPSEWIHSRLYKNNEKRQYDKIRFTNGYGANRPWFECEFKGADLATLNETLHFATGQKLVLKGHYQVIRLGKILESGNLEQLKPTKNV